MSDLSGLAARECGGVKHDSDKRRMDLVPVELINATADVMTRGAAKYGDYNWLRGMPWSRVYSALQRHLTAWFNGEDEDSETGLSHLAHAACNVAFLLVYEERNIGRDDRPTGQLELGFLEDGGRGGCIAAVQRLNDLLDTLISRTGPGLDG